MEKKSTFFSFGGASPLKLHEFWRRGGRKLQLHTKLWRPVLRRLERQKCNREAAGGATGGLADSWMLFKSAFLPNRRIHVVLGS